MKKCVFALFFVALVIFPWQLARAGEEISRPEKAPLAARMESNWKLGSKRSILMNEFWIPVAQNVEDGSVIYTDWRFMADDQDNREFNLGLGYRKLIETALLGEGIAGTHIWLDRRITERGSAFNQITAGAEWYAEDWELKVNTYLPLNTSKTYTQANPNGSGGSFSGTQIVVKTDQTVVEESLRGIDFELGYKLPLPENITDSTRIYTGGYYFAGDEAEDVTGWRTRFTSDITPDIQIGARFQKDDVRGSQGFLEATIRLPFGHKKSYRKEGLRARLDESPERDIDIVTNEALTDDGTDKPLLNTTTGTIQNVYHVDNTAAGGGDGSAENPFNTLAAAQAAAGTNDIIYVHRGNGTAAGQNTGVTIDDDGQMLIGEGSAISFSGGMFTLGAGSGSAANLIIPAGNAPVISNTNPNGDGVTVTADNIYLSGFTVDGASRDGILVEGNAASAQNVTITNVTASNNRTGIYIHGYNGGDVSAMVEQSITTGNSQHGIAVYDDTAGTFEVDLGGGSLGSAGLNILAGNTLEDLAVDYDGRTLSARNNWWGFATGPDLDDPSDGFRPQIYYGAPIEDSLAGNWTFDSEWTTNTTAYDRSANANNGTLLGGLSLADQVTGQYGEALNFDGINDTIRIPHSASLNIANNITVLIWINGLPQTVDPWASYIVKGNNVTGYWLTARANTADSHARVDTDAFFNDTLLVNGGLDGNWNQYAVTMSSGDMQTYMNLVNAPNPYPHGTGFATTADAYIGSFLAGSDWYQGSLDEVRIYSRVLSASEISELYRMDTTSTVNTTGFLSAAP